MPSSEYLVLGAIVLALTPLALWALKELIGIQYIANDRVGVVEKLWGGSIKDGRIIALDGEAGFQCDVKRGGLHFGLPRWKYRIHRVPLVSIAQGEIGYVYARDAYEPELPLSLVVHIDYQKAPGVIQRFGDVKKLITQTIDPMLSAYFRDVSHKRSMLELLQSRDEIQVEARRNLRERFTEFDIECVDVLIGKPEVGKNDGGKIETLLEQLRQRQLSVEQVQTFEQQRIAADKRRTLEEATAVANKQKDLTNSSVDIRIVENQANAQLAKAEMGKKQTIVEAVAALEQARRQVEQTVIRAEADGKKVVIAARAQSEQEQLLGKGEGIRALQVGLAQAEALRKQVMAYGDPRLYALVMAAQSMSQSQQPLVPERVFVTGGGTDGDGKTAPAGGNPLQMLLNLLLANQTAFAPAGTDEGSPLREASEKVIGDLMNGIAAAPSQPAPATTTP